METITTKRGNPIAPSAIDGMVSQADHLNYRALRAREEPADGKNGVPRFLAIVSTPGRSRPVARAEASRRASFEAAALEGPREAPGRVEEESVSTEPPCSL